MTTGFFDSHKYAKRLIDSGLPPATADVQAETMVEIVERVNASSAKVDKQDSKIDVLAHKIDLNAAETKALIAAQTALIAAQTALIERTSNVTTRWMIGLCLTTIGSVIGAIKFLT